MTIEMKLNDIRDHLDELMEAFTDERNYVTKQQYTDTTVVITGVEDKFQMKMIAQKIYQLNDENRERMFKYMNTHALKDYLLYLTLQSEDIEDTEDIEYIKSIEPKEETFIEFNTEDNYVVIVDPHLTDSFGDSIAAKITLIDMTKQELHSISLVLLIMGEAKIEKQNDEYIN